MDLSITLPLTERVIVKRQADGTMQVSHPAEPVADDELFLVPAMRVETPDGALLAEWGGSG